jgi:hypothetical protein
MRGCWIAAVVTAAAACSGRGDPAPKPEAPPAVRAFPITSDDQLVRGITASGRAGDIKMENGVVEIVVSDPKNVLGFALSGGHVIDAARKGGDDNLRQIFLYLDDTFPRQGVFDRVAIETAAGDEAVVVATGVDSENPALAIRSEYRLARDADYLTMATTITNTGDVAVPSYELGDVIQWGVCERFVPGRGFARGRIETEWLAGVGPNVSYGFAKRSGSLRGPHGTSWSDPISDTADLAPGGSARFERVLIVGDDRGVASAAERVFELRGEPVSPLRGTVVDPRGGLVAGAVVEAALDGAPMMRAITRADGAFALPLAPGNYEVSASAPGRAAAPVPVPFATEGAPIQIALPDPAIAAVRVTPAGGARLMFFGDGATTTPQLGPRHLASGADNVVIAIDGATDVELAPGTYRVLASRGLEWTAADAVFTVEAGGRAKVALELERAVDTRGYIGGDFHQHALPSGDSQISLADRVATNVAEGVEILVATDHNQVTDYGPIARELGVANQLAVVVGVEATSETEGHFNAYPVPYQPARPRSGAPEVAHRTAGEILRALRGFAADAVLQVNHPRALGNGYFGIAGLDPAGDAALPDSLSVEFDAIEVANGRRMSDTPQVMRDWFGLLRRGHIVTAMGNSDSHAVTDAPVGYPRSYIGVGYDDPTRLTNADIRRAIHDTRDVMITNGPFLRISRADGTSAIGATLEAKRAAVVTVSIQAAPWVDVATLQIYRDGKRWKQLAVDAGYRADWKLPAGSFYAFAVLGKTPLDPIVPGALPFALANPIWVRAPR